MSSVNRSPKPTTYSPTGGSRRSIVDAFHKLPNWVKTEEEAAAITLARRRRSTLNGAPLQQRELVQIILEDKEQWEKLHQAMKEQKNCTSMGLTQNLRFLIQDRINDMELNHSTSTIGMDGSSSTRSRSLTS